MSERPAARYLPLNRKQHVLRPLDLEHLVDEDHPARKIWRVVESLDLSGFESEVRAVEGVAGRSAHSPHLLVSVWIYAYSKRLHSAREIARQMEHEPGLEWLTALRPINHHTLSDFRVSHGEALRELFIQVLGMLAKSGLITLNCVAVDGTKIRADAGRKSFRRSDGVRTHLTAARRHIEELEREQRIAEAQAEIKRLRAAKKHDKRKAPQASTTDPAARFMRNGDGGLAPAYNVQVAADGAHGLIVDIEAINDPQDAVQLVPAMERLKKSWDRYPQQALADGGYTNHVSVVAMSERGIDFYGTMTGRSSVTLGGTGGCQPEYRLDRFDYDETTNEMICPEGKRLAFRSESQLVGGRRLLQWTARGEDCRACPARMKCCPRLQIKRRGRSVSWQQAHEAVEAFDRKMATPEAQRIYSRRAPLVEFANAWIKQKLGLRRFSTRGRKKVQCEALWAALTHNLQRAFQLAPQLLEA